MMIAFDDWHRTFAESRKGKAALGELDCAFANHATPEHCHHLQVRVLKACYHAQQWASIGDIAQSKRQRDREFAKGADDTRRHIRAIGQHLRRYKHQWHRQSVDAVALAALLAAADEALAAHNVPRGPWLHRFTYGCLHFDAPRETNSAPIAIETPLLFNLVFLFRRFSCDPSRFASYQLGERMPPEGQPHYPEAAAFVAAVHRVDINARQASDRMRKLITGNFIGLIDWPIAD